MAAKDSNDYGWLGLSQAAETFAVERDAQQQRHGERETQRELNAVRDALAMMAME